MITIFTEHQDKLANFLLEKNEIMPLSELYSTEVKQVAIAWAFYSGKIEGNTYTFLETEALLKDGITAPRRYEDAKELKNLYNTFIYFTQEDLKEAFEKSLKNGRKL